MSQSSQFFINCFFVLILFSSLNFSLAQAETQSAKNDLVEPAYQSLENDPRAVVKTGLFVGIVKDQVSLFEGDNARKKNYRLEPDYKIIFNNQVSDLKELGLSQIPPHSVVKLIMIDGQVCEIILLEVSS